MNKKLLKEIANDSYAIGPFSGMIFNAKVQHPEKTVDELVETALEVRDRIVELTKEPLDPEGVLKKKVLSVE